MLDSPMRYRLKPQYRYGIAVLSTLVALGLRAALDPILLSSGRFVTFFGSVMVTSWAAGLGPSILAAILGGLAAAYYFFPPHESFYIAAAKDQLSLVIYMLVSGGFVFFGRVMQRAYEGAAADREQLAWEVTERRKAENRMEQYRLLAENTGDIVLFARPNGRIVEANAAAVAAYGYEYSTLLTLSLEDLHASHSAIRLPDQLAQATAGGDAFETVHRRCDESTFPAEVSSRSPGHGRRTLVEHRARHHSAQERRECLTR